MSIKRAKLALFFISSLDTSTQLTFIHSASPHSPNTYDFHTHLDSRSNIQIHSIQSYSIHSHDHRLQRIQKCYSHQAFTHSVHTKSRAGHHTSQEPLINESIQSNASHHVSDKRIPKRTPKWWRIFKRKHRPKHQRRHRWRQWRRCRQINKRIHTRSLCCLHPRLSVTSRRCPLRSIQYVRHCEAWQLWEWFGHFWHEICWSSTRLTSHNTNRPGWVWCSGCSRRLDRSHASPIQYRSRDARA